MSVYSSELNTEPIFLYEELAEIGTDLSQRMLEKYMNDVNELIGDLHADSSRGLFSASKPLQPCNFCPHRLACMIGTPQSAGWHPIVFLTDMQCSRQALQHTPAACSSCHEP